MKGKLPMRMFNVTITHRNLLTECYSDMVYETNTMSAKRKAWSDLVRHQYTKNIFLNDYVFTVELVRIFDDGYTL